MLLAWLLNFRRPFVRYERNAANFLGMLHLASALILLSLSRAALVLRLARRCTGLWLREGLDTVTISCRLRDVFSPGYVNVDKLQAWVQFQVAQAVEREGGCT